MDRERLSDEDDRELARRRGDGQDGDTIAGVLGGTAESRRDQFARAPDRVGIDEED